MRQKNEIYDKLCSVNKMLQINDRYLHLRVVGSAALILNGTQTIETYDIDTISRIEWQVGEILDECQVDINDEALDYIDIYSGLDFIYDDRKTFSNITVEYLDVCGAVKTKMMVADPYKLEALYDLMEGELGVDMTVDGILQWFADNGMYDVPQWLVEGFLDEVSR